MERGGRAAWCLPLALAVALAVAPSGMAHPESAASALRADVVAVGHTPDEPEPGSQWTAFIQLAPGHDIESVGYQICQVARACFAPETPARREGDTFHVDTRDYATPPVRWGIGDGQDWSVGYKFILHHLNGSASKFPAGIAYGTPGCEALGTFECDATNYFVFTFPGAAVSNDVPSPATVVTGLVMLLAALAMRRGAGRA